MWVGIILGTLGGIVFGALALPKIIVKRENKKLGDIVQKIKDQKLKFKIDGREVKFVEKDGVLNLEEGPKPIIPKQKIEKKKVIKSKKTKKKGKKK